MHEQRRVTRPRSNNLILSLASIQRAKGSLGLFLARTAPHQPRKKRELTRAVELLKTKYGGGIEPHRHSVSLRPLQMLGFFRFWVFKIL